MKKILLLILLATATVTAQTNYPFRANVTPATDSFFDLGRPELKWDSLFVNNIAGFMKTTDTAIIPTRTHVWTERQYHTAPTFFYNDSTVFRSDSTSILAWQEVYLAGTVSMAFETNVVIGTGTSFTTDFAVGELISMDTEAYYWIDEIVNDELIYTQDINENGDYVDYPYTRYAERELKTARPTMKYNRGLFSIEGDTALFSRKFPRDQNNFVYYPLRGSLFIDKKSSGTDELDSSDFSSYSLSIGFNNKMYPQYQSNTIIGSNDTIEGSLSAIIGATGSSVKSQYGIIMGGYNNYNYRSQHSMIVGRQDSIYSSTSQGQNFIFGNVNVIGRENTGALGNWLFGQYLRSENIGVWAFGADDNFQKKNIPFNGSIVFVNENVKHWGSNNMNNLYDYMPMSYAIQSPHVKDTMMFAYRYQKYGSAVDSLANAGLHFEIHRQFTRYLLPNGEVQRIANEGTRMKRLWSLNVNDDDALHFNTYNTSGKPFAPIYVDSSHLIVSLGYIEGDSLRFNGTTVGTRLAYHSGLGASYWGAMTVGSLTSIGAISGTTGTFSGNVVPSTDGNYDLGSASPLRRWDSLFVYRIDAGRTTDAYSSYFTTSGAFPIVLQRANNGVGALAGIDYKLYSSSSTLQSYADAGAIVQGSNVNGQGGGYLIRTYKSGVATPAIFSDSLQRTVIGSTLNLTTYANYQPSTTARLTIRNGLFSNIQEWYNNRGTVIGALDSVGGLTISALSATTGSFSSNVKVTNSTSTYDSTSALRIYRGTVSAGSVIPIAFTALNTTGAEKMYGGIGVVVGERTNGIETGRTWRAILNKSGTAYIPFEADSLGRFTVNGSLFTSTTQFQVKGTTSVSQLLGLYRSGSGTAVAYVDTNGNALLNSLSTGTISASNVNATGTFLSTQYSTSLPFESRSTTSDTRWRWGIYSSDSTWRLEKVGFTYPITVYPATGRVRFIEDIDVDGGQIRSTQDLEVVPAGGDFAVTAIRSSVSGNFSTGSTSSASVIFQYGQAPYFVQKNNTESDGGIVFQDEQDTTQRGFITYGSGTNTLTIGNSTATGFTMNPSGNVFLGHGNTTTVYNGLSVQDPDFAQQLNVYRTTGGLLNASSGIINMGGFANGSLATYARIGALNIDTTSSHDGYLNFAVAMNGTVSTVATLKNDTSLWVGTNGVTPVANGKIYTGFISLESGLSSFNGTNSGTATIGAGDSVQVTVTGITTSQVVIVSYYGDGGSTFTKQAPWVGYKRTDGFTIYGDNGKTVNYWVAKK